MSEGVGADAEAASRAAASADDLGMGGSETGAASRLAALGYPSKEARNDLAEVLAASIKAGGGFVGSFGLALFLARLIETPSIVPGEDLVFLLLAVSVATVFPLGWAIYNLFQAWIMAGLMLERASTSPKGGRAPEE
jgi:hypothetical protein